MPTFLDFQRLLDVPGGAVLVCIGLLPLLSAAVLALGGQHRYGYGLAFCLQTGMVLLSAYLLMRTQAGASFHGSLRWWHLLPNHAQIAWAIRADFPTAVMLNLTATMSWCTYLYAGAYLAGDKRRYLVLSSIFVGAMLCFLMADNLVVLLMGWELISAAAYPLIGFSYQHAGAAQSGTKAWLINHVGSTLLLIGILLIGHEIGTFDLQALHTLARGAHSSALTWARLCLVGGVAAKSVQWPLFSWLPNAMTAPTPASALIHTATLVGAGVHLLVRVAPLLDKATCCCLAYMGSLTAITGACAALTLYHSKSVLAYSTIAHLGYVVMAIGVGASGAGLYHFVTHALGKAALFLCVGMVSHYLQHQGVQATENLAHMGGLRRVLPGVWGVYGVAACSLVGVPGLPGFSSKEAVLAHAWAWARQQALAGHWGSYGVPMAGSIASVLAALYMVRHGYLIFGGSARWMGKAPSVAPYKMPKRMWGSSMVLVSGLVALPYSGLLHALAQSVHGATPSMPAVVSQGMWVMALLPLAAGSVYWAMGCPEAPTTVRAPWVHWVCQGGYLDALNDRVARWVLALSQRVAQWDQAVIGGSVRCLASGYRGLSHAVHWLDQRLLACLVQGVAAGPVRLGQLHRATQTGHWQHYVWWTFLGLALLCMGLWCC